LQQMLDFGAVMILLTTPNRNALYGPSHSGPPKNPHHVREWNRGELNALLFCNGMGVAVVEEFHDTLYAVLARREIPSPASLLAGTWAALDFARRYVYNSVKIEQRKKALESRRWERALSIAQLPK